MSILVISGSGGISVDDSGSGVVDSDCGNGSCVISGWCWW